MIHRFAHFEIDEATREVRAGERVLTLQPRVFDLLVFLARNRDRVVPKDELLDAVWPEVTVADGSLQRAVSLARNALEAAGAENAIRTYSRQGYRFCAEASVATNPEATATTPPLPALVAARTAYAAGDWPGVVARYEAIDRVDGLEGEDLQRWAHAARCAGKPHEAIPPLERAVVAFTVRGDRRRAGWVAVLITMLRVEWREFALAKGWYHRASRLLEHEPPCRERGYLDFLGGRMALMENDIEGALALSRCARDAGEQFNDPDLEGLGLMHCGEASLYLGNIREGLAALDEAGAAVAGSKLSPWAGGLIYCGVIFSCMTRADWQRTTQWTDQFTRWSADKGAAGYPGLCQMHRAEVLILRGKLQEAEKVIRSTIATLARQAPWAEGEAWKVLGDILVVRGDFSGADPDLTSTPALQALLGRARGELAAAEGRTADVLNQFRTAIRISQTIQAPLPASQIRCRLAGLLADQGDREAALIELTAAAPILEEAGSVGLLNHCAKVRGLLDPSRSP